MALPTKDGPHENHATHQKPTHGIGQQGDQPAMPPAPAPEPVLFEDIDPVLLVRLYPKAANSDAARADAMKAGHEAKEAGAKLKASQQEPIGEAAPEPQQAA